MLAKSHRNMKNTPFRSAQSLLFPGSVVTCRILILALLATLSATQASAANSGSATKTISDDGKTCTWTELSFAVDKNSQCEANGLIFQSSSSKTISTKSDGVYLTIDQVLYIQVPSQTVTGTLTLTTQKNPTRGVTFGTENKLVLNNAGENSITFGTADIVNLDGTAYLKGVAYGGECKITQIKVVLDATCTDKYPMGTPAECTWNIDYSVVGQSDWVRECFTQVGTTEEWRLPFTLPSGDQQFWVGTNETTSQSKTVSFSTITTVGLQRTSCNKIYPGEGVTGYLRIYSHYTDENYYIAFEPTYAIIYGVEGTDWTNSYNFTDKGSNTYETDLVTLPSDFSDKTYQFYVGTRKADNGVNYITDKSNTMAMTTMDGLQSGDLNETKGIFRMYDNSCNSNWYSAFIPYYNYILYDNDGKVFFASEYVSSETTEADRTITFPTNAPTKEGYECIGWSRTQNATTTEMTAGEKYTYWTANDKFYPVWEATEMWNVTLYDADGNVLETKNCYPNAATLTTELPTLEKEGFIFLGWAHAADATAPDYMSGATYTFSKTGDALYPVWKGNEIEPKTTVWYVYGYAAIDNNGALVQGLTGAKSQMLRLDGTKASGTTDITMSPAIGKRDGSYYIGTLANILDDSKWGNAATNATLQGVKMTSGKEYVINLKECTASKVTFIVQSANTKDEGKLTFNNQTSIIIHGGNYNIYKFTEPLTGDIPFKFEKDGFGAIVIEVQEKILPKCTEPKVAITGDYFVEGTSSICTEKLGEWSGWTATATFDVLPDDETCTLQWYDENNSPVGDAVTTEIGSTETTLTCTYQPTTAGTYYAQAIVSSTDTEKSSSTAQATATLELLSAPAAPTIRADRTEVEQDGSVTLTATGIDESKVSIHWMLSNQSTPEGATYTLIEEDAATATPYEWHVPADAKAGDIYYLCCEVDGQCGSVYSDIIPITVKERVETTCKDIASATITEDKTNMIASIGGIAVSDGQKDGNYMKLGSDNATITITADTKYAPFKEGDKLYVICYNKANSESMCGFKITDKTSSAITASIPKQTTGTVEYTLSSNDIQESGTIILVRSKSEDRYESIRVERCGLLPFPELAYDNKNIEKQFSTPEIPQPLNNPHAVSPITYTSSNTDVATVDGEGKVTYIAIGTTTITAAFAGNEKYSEETASYTLTVNAPAWAEFTAALSTNTETITCEDATLTITTDNATDAEYTWYRREADIKTPIEGTKDNTYATSQAGEFIALVSANGYAQWTNAVTITKNSTVTGATITRLTPFHHYRKGCAYAGPNDHPIRHLFLVDSKELTLSEGEKAYSIRLSKHNGGTSESVNINMDADNPWLYESKDTIMLDLQRLHNAGCDEHVEEGDTLSITIVPLNACGDYDENQASNIDIMVVGKDKRALAFIVSGCDPTSATPYEPVLGGDFFADINKRNLWLRTGENTWNENKDGVLWGGLRASNTFIPTAVNGYAEFDIFNYEPFDIIMLSDYVRTNATGNAGYAYFDKLAQLVDYRPILSLKSHMSRKELTGWRAKGFLADPVSLTGATEMKVLCLGHTILSGIKDTYFNKETGILNVLKEPGYEDNKGLQGFLSRDLVGFVNIGYIDTGADGKPLAEPLIACCERQNNLAARMMILSINSEATPKLTPGGVEAIRAMLYYLMETSESKIEDCSNVFDNNKGTGDHNWSNTANWTYGHLPLLASNVQIMEDCNVDMMDAAAGVLKIESGKKLTINADASLRVAKRFGQRDGNLRIKPLPNGDYSIVTIKADADGSGTLIHSAFAADATHPEGYEIPATVEYYSIASGAPDNCQYQWMASPVQNIPQAEVPFAGAWVYGWDTDTHTWGNYLRNGDSMTAFDAYCFTQRTGGKNTYKIQGKLVNIQTDTIALSYNATLSAARQGINVIGNSWTAPINIRGWTEADFKNCEASIILFNTGFDPAGTGTQVANGTNLAGQYSTIPVNTASNMDVRYQVIPVMQAFQVNATSAGAKLTMDYDRLVRTDKVNRQPMHIQGRRNAEGTESTDLEGITTTLRIYVKGERYGDQVYIFRNADCTAGYDNGWDGHKILGAAAALQLFVESEGERYAVSTQPELAGTRLAFFKGEDDTYTMEFDYNGEETLYLYDSNTDRYTPVFTGSTYFFRSETTKLEHRFLLTDNRPEEPSGPTTGIVEVDIEDNSLILSNTTQDPVTLSIFDAAGRLCYQQTLHTPLATIPVPNLPGVYMVEAASRTQHVTRKIIL